jgi:hypothetical protein
MARKLLVIGIMLVMLFTVVGLVGCTNSHGIPNGRYVETSEGPTLFEKGMTANDRFWQIRGNTATHYTSNQKSTTWTIVQRDGKIFFESDNFSREVVYNADTKSIIFVPTT